MIGETQSAKTLEGIEDYLCKRHGVKDMPLAITIISKEMLDSPNDKIMVRLQSWNMMNVGER